MLLAHGTGRLAAIEQRSQAPARPRPASMEAQLLSRARCSMNSCAKKWLVGGGALRAAVQRSRVPVRQQQQLQQRCAEGGQGLRG